LVRPDESRPSGLDTTVYSDSGALLGYPAESFDSDSVLSCSLLLFAALYNFGIDRRERWANCSTGVHREDVDVSRYPWSAIGKLTNETGGSCSGVVISREKVSSIAAHQGRNTRR
jgi:hypothetical protein